MKSLWDTNPSVLKCISSRFVRFFSSFYAFFYRSALQFADDDLKMDFVLIVEREKDFIAFIPNIDSIKSLCSRLEW